MASRRALLSGRALVTGASGGLGTAIARELAKRDATVTLTGRRIDALESLASQIGATTVPCDLADRSQLSPLLDVATRVDVLVCNAALPATGQLDDFTIDEIDRALDVNLRAPMLLARAAGRAMADRGEGHIVFVSSMAAKVVGPSLGLYGATKAGLRALTFALRQDLRGAGVGVSVILPGPIRDAGMWADAGLPTPRGAGRTFPPKAVADAVCKAITKNRAEVVVASTAVRMGGVLAQWRPDWFALIGRQNGAEAIAKQMTSAARSKR